MMRASLGGGRLLHNAFVLDSWPVMEWLKKREPVTVRFRELLERAESGHQDLFLSSINLGEIYYNSSNEWGSGPAEQILRNFHKLPIRVVHPSERDVLLAARLKAEFRISYADCFAVVLAAELDCPVVTGDTDFQKLVRRGVLEVEWLGA